MAGAGMTRVGFWLCLCVRCEGSIEVRVGVFSTASEKRPELFLHSDSGERFLLLSLPMTQSFFYTTQLESFQEMAKNNILLR